MSDVKDDSNDAVKSNDPLDSASWLKKKFFVPEGVTKSRLQICSKCEHYNLTTKMCGVCHCIMPLKARLASTKCPKKKWHAFVRPTKRMSEL